MRIKTLLVAGLLLSSLATAPALAQRPGAISGTITDSSGQPVAGATVSLVELGIATRSATDGSFSFDTAPDAEYTVVVRHAGLRTLSIPHTRPGSSLGNLTLASSPIVIPQVTVTATRTAIATGASVLPVSELSEDQLRREATISLAHSLVRLPGVHSVSTGEQIGKPMIRGLFGSRVLTLQDGSRLEDYSFSEEDAPSVDARLAQRVEVIRGPASVLYGSDAIGGVVNVIPYDLPVATGGRGFSRAGGEIYGASNNLETGGALTLEGARRNIGWRATGIGRFAQSFRTPVGEIENTGYFSVNGEAAAAIRGTRSNTTLRFSHYGGEFKLLEARGPGSGAAAEGEEEGPERKLADDRLQLVNEYVAGPMRFEAKALLQRHSLVEVSDDLCITQPAACAGEDANAPMERPAFDLLLNTGTLDLLAHHSLAPSMRGVAGIQGLIQSNDSRGPIFLVPGATTRSAAAYIFEELQIGRLGIAAGGRIDTRHLSREANSSLGLESGSERDWTEPSGSAGAVLHLTPSLAITANAGLAWRAPTLFELFANGPHLAEGRFEIGDPSLDAEHAHNLDAGLRFHTSRLSAEIDGFRNDIDNFVYITPTAGFRDQLRVYRHEQADARLTGAEASVQVEAARGLLLRGRHDFVRGTNRDSGQPLPLIPPRRTSGGAEYHFTRAWADDAVIGGEVENVSRQTRPNPQDVVTAGYTLVNFNIGMNRQLFGRSARINLGIRNAANRKYRSFLNRYKEFALEPGRNLVLRISTE